MSLVDQFATLFDGREDAWGALHGECVRSPITADLWHGHLYGKGSLGIYPLVDGHVHWGCTDIDEGFDMLALAVNVWRALKALGITSWVEKTKGKGYHVWVLLGPNVWVPAVDMRGALMLAHQLADVKPREVNPKAVELSEAKPFSNYVNLPYCQSAPPGRRVVLDMDRSDRAPMTLRDFLGRAEASLNDPATIHAAAALYVPPPPPKTITDDAYAGDLEPLVRRLGGLAFTHFTKGPLPDLNTGRTDRSTGVMRMAHLLAEDGFDAAEALALLADFDSRYGKFGERADGLEQLRRILGRAL